MRQCGQYMSTGEYQDVAVECPESGDGPIDPLGNLQDGFAAGTTVAKEIPVRALSMDLHQSSSLVTTVVPLDQVRVDRRYASKARELAGSQRPSERTREHVVKP
jgi:hypothetical protein